MTSRHRLQGRPRATTHALIEEAAFGLFDAKGFEATTVDEIAAAVGIGRRTLFRYYPSKNDIPWGQFDASLSRLAARLRAMPHDIPVYRAIQRAVVEFNQLEPAAVAQHRRRMTLLFGAPALQAHSAVRYAQWRRIIAEYVAYRHAVSPDDLMPRVVGHVCLALALAAYEEWLAADGARSLDALLERALGELRGYLADDDGVSGAFEQ